MITIRAERAQDIAGISHVNQQAFQQTAEAELVDQLRVRGKLRISLVAESDDEIVGHIAFSQVQIDSGNLANGLGLGPLAVRPGLQKQGIGSRLVRAGLERCRELGFDYVVVLGHADYYPRFGFSPASRFGIRCIWPVPDEVFMALELRSGALREMSGLIAYEPEFDNF
ncbi:MAG TPA: N-acetyltransferase [Blastocatellia bacterium]|nr:N-acetyltransferase [Blastocatellia bacterium]